ncbi:MAG: ABC transporter ATP-binding protein [Microbacterium sp.]
MSPERIPLLRIDGLEVAYGRRRERHRVLRGVSLDVGTGEAVGIIGETGSGKTTLARAVVGLVRAQAGSIAIDGERVTAHSARQWAALRRRGVVQYVFQDPLRALDPEVSIRDSLAEPLRLQRRLSLEQIDGRIAYRIEQVRLSETLLDRFPGELSGGQRQRVLLARALVTEPRLLILDEPVSALDAISRVAVLEILNSLRASGTSLVFISHDLGSVAGVTDRVAVLHRGAIVEDAPTAEVIRRPRHPYTRLLVGSASTLARGTVTREDRARLRAALAEASSA